jgi:UDP-N-acetylmuramate dehydrogenase
VTFQFTLGDLGAPVQYAELAGALGIDLGERAPTRDVRDAVLDLRRRKGMVLEADDHDTWSTGSFFTNPIVPATHVPEGAPTWPQTDGLVKTSAAWLIERAGFRRGYGDPEGIAISSKHVLALTNRGHGTTAQLVALAREIAGGVREAFGVALVPEPVFVGHVWTDATQGV